MLPMRVALRFIAVSVVALLAACVIVFEPFTQVYENPDTSSGGVGTESSDDVGTAWIAPVNDGGYFLAGWTASTPRYLLARRTDASGVSVWEHVLSDLPATPSIFGTRQVSDGGFLVWGYYSATGVANEAFVLKITGDGQTAWTHTFGGPGLDYAYELVERSDGYVFTGATNSSGAGDFDVWVVELDYEGNVVRADTFGGTGDDEAMDLDATSDGGFVVAAKNPSAGAGAGHIEVLRYASSGALAWNVFIGPVGSNAEPAAIRSSPDGGVFVSGYEDVPNMMGTKAIGHLYKLSNAGAVLWDAPSTDDWRTIGGPIAVASDGSVVQVRTSRPELGNTNRASFTRYSSTGGQLATSSWPLSSMPLYSGWSPYTVLATSDGGYVVLAALYDGAVSHPFTVIKVDASLQRQWFIDWTGDPGSVHLGTTLDGWFVVCGYPPQPYTPGTQTWLVRPGTDGTVVPPS